MTAKLIWLYKNSISLLIKILRELWGGMRGSESAAYFDVSEYYRYIGRWLFRGLRDNGRLAKILRELWGGMRGSESLTYLDVSEYYRYIGRWLFRGLRDNGRLAKILRELWGGMRGSESAAYFNVREQRRFPEGWRLRNSQDEGYSLIELAVSLLILSILLTGGLTVASHIDNNYKTRITNERIVKIQQALHMFYSINKHLPCPASSSAYDSDRYFGISPSHYFDAGNSNACIGGNGDQATPYGTGMVPTRALYLADEYAFDGWNRKFTYRLATGLGSASTFAQNNYRSNIKIIDINGMQKTSLYAPIPDNYGAAYVIISFGPNGASVAWGKNSNTSPYYGNGYEAYNTYDKNNVYIQNAPTKHFADIVAFETKLAFIDGRRAASPIFMPQSVCSNAKTLLNKFNLPSGDISIDAHGSIPVGFANNYNSNILNSAQMANALCDNSPITLCSINPSAIDNLVIWLDGNNPNGPGTIPPNDQAIISTWSNRANGGSNATLGAGSPRYVTSTSSFSNNSGLMGAMNFDGLSYFTSDFSFLNNSDYTIFLMMAANPNIICSQGAMSGSNIGINQNLHMGLYPTSQITGYSSSAPQTCLAYSGQYNNDIAIGLGLKHSYSSQPLILIARLNTNSSNGPIANDLQLYTQDNEYYHNSNDSNIAQLSSYNTQYIGRDIATAFQGQIGEIIAYNRAISNDEIAAIVNYLHSKWFEGNCTW